MHPGNPPSEQKHGPAVKKRLYRRLLRIAVAVLAAYLLAAAAAFAFQKYFVYHPAIIAPDEKIILPPGDDEVWIEVLQTGKIHGIYHRAPPSGLTVLFFHGNAGNIQSWRPIYDGLAAEGFGVLMIDYPGFGKSQGGPCEENLYASARAAAEFLQAQGTEKRRTVVFGKSLGTAVATRLASSSRFAAVVLESPFTSLAAVGQHHFKILPVSLLLREKFDTISRIDKIACPLLVVIGTADTLVPPEESLKLYEAARQPKDLLVIEGASHNNIQHTGGQTYWRNLRNWLDSLPQDTELPR